MTKLTGITESGGEEMADERFSQLTAIARKHSANDVETFNAIISALVEADGLQGAAEVNGKRVIAFHCLVDATLNEDDAIQEAWRDLVERGFPKKKAIKRLGA
jgi:hypothetical protein